MVILFNVQSKVPEAVDPICGVSLSPTNSCKLGLDTETGNKHTNALVCCVAMRDALSLLLSVGSVTVVTGLTRLYCQTGSDDRDCSLSFCNRSGS
ncbi:hypothetical protein BpHYR1_029260 [Brachionus plicatilis]|uniref:Uncharacterized protein n=1 Tax=Brachionus plicatilis TaxID=10195 RepID=A0A3M7S2L0_BRAPC|nr:hypothetical protein BpHYR1_029260 [Brachionus plicatilis]